MIYRFLSTLPNISVIFKTKKNSEILNNALYEFQQKGAESLINRIEKYNGAILADAVGLGKTWTALAVMKYFQNKRDDDGNQKYDILLLCPKKLHQNWLKYRKEPKLSL